MQQRPSDPAKPIWVRPRQACDLGGFGMTKLYNLLNRDIIESRKVDGLRLVSVASIERLGRSEVA